MRVAMATMRVSAIAASQAPVAVDVWLKLSVAFAWGKMIDGIVGRN